MLRQEEDCGQRLGGGQGWDELPTVALSWVPPWLEQRVCEIGEERP